MRIVNALKKAMKKGAIPPVRIKTKKDYVSTGSTIFNLACSGRSYGGLEVGMAYLFIGDTSAGKTWMGMSCLAEAAINPDFDDYGIYHHPCENGTHMNVGRYFGKKLENKLLPLMGTPEEPNFTTVLEDFWDGLIAVLKKGPCVVLLDSFDALRPLAQIRLERAQAKARAKSQKEGKEEGEDKEPASFGVDKAKINTARFREANALIAKYRSIFIGIAQTRQKIGFGSQLDPKTFSGGDALRFYPRIHAWMSIRERQKVEKGGIKQVVGQTTKVKITKNHLCGWEGELEIPFLKRHGIDDTGSCVDFLVESGHWKMASGFINTSEFGKLRREKLIGVVESEDGNIRKLKKLVVRKWKEIEASVTPERRSRYE